MKKYIAILMAIFLFCKTGFAQTPDDYFRIAAENNPGLLAVYKEYEAALQKVPQVSTLPDPVFSFGYFISPVETRLGPQQAKFSLTQMFPWLGTLKAQGDAAALLADAKFQTFIDARNKLYFRVASAYYPLYEIKDWIRIEQENISILESYKTLATRNLGNDEGTMVDVLRVDIMLMDAQTNLSILQDKEKPLLTIFNNLLNRPVDEPVVITDSLKAGIPMNVFTSDSLIAANPKLKALDLKLQAGKAMEIVARKQGLPQVGIGLDYVIVGERNDVSIPDNGRDIFMPMVSLSIPVFRGKYNAAASEARLMQESYAQQKEEETNMLVSDYEMVLFEIQQQDKLIELYEQQIDSSQQSLNLLLRAYANSEEDFENVLRMQQQVLKYRKMKATALVQYKIAVAKINYLTSKTY